MGLIFVVAAGTLLIAAAIGYRKQLKELYSIAKVVADHHAAGTAPMCEENEEENKDFALAWYHAGAKAVLDLQVKSALVTDLTIDQKFNEEWDALDNSSDESVAQE